MSIKIMNILIATQNSDKFRIGKGLLSECGLADSCFKNLGDVNISSQTEEYGDVINRALMKAQNAYRAIDKNERIDIFMGQDDGMKYKNGETDANSKEVVEKILHHNLLDIGETLIIVRAFALLNGRGEIIDKFETETPYKFIGNPKNIQLLDNKYPLSFVLSSLEGRKSMAEMGEEEAMKYYLRFSGERMKEAVEKIVRRG